MTPGVTFDSTQKMNGAMLRTFTPILELPPKTLWLTRAKENVELLNIKTS